MLISFDQKARAVLAKHGHAAALVLTVGQSAGCCHIPRVISRWHAIEDARSDKSLHYVGEAEGVTVFAGKRLLPYLPSDTITITAAGIGRRLLPADMTRIRTALMFELEDAAPAE